jgi:hypothetical protein
MLNNNATRWIVGILVVFSLITSFYHAYSFYDISRGLDDITKNIDESLIKIVGGDYSKQTEDIKEMLTEDGYEVLSVLIMNYTKDAPFLKQYGIEDDTICESNETSCFTKRVGVFVTMKSLGTRNTQIWDALRTEGIIYPNAWLYWITIKSPTDTCEYMIIGNTYRDYLNVDIANNYSEENLALGREKMAKVQENIDTFVECS